MESLAPVQVDKFPGLTKKESFSFLKLVTNLQIDRNHMQLINAIPLSHTDHQHNDHTHTHTYIYIYHIYIYIYIYIYMYIYICIYIYMVCSILLLSS